MAFIDPKTVPQRTLFTGEKIPCIGMGTFGSDRFTPDQVSSAVAGAIRCGYRLFDCASVYGNEDQIGKVFARAFEEGVVKREELFVTSKVWNDMHGKGDVLLSMAKTLKDLRLDYVDAYFVHWPFPNYHAPGCDGDSRNPDSKPFSVEEFMLTWRQMERLYEMGLTRYLGMSNMTIPKLKAVLPLVKIKPALIEMELHPAIICLKWAAQRGQIPIPFSVKEPQYVSNLKCVTEDPLTDEEMETLRAADKNCRLIKGQVFLWPGATHWQDLWDLNGEITK